MARWFPSILKVAGSIPAAEAVPIYTMQEGALVVLPMRVEGASSQLDLPSLVPLSVAGCGRLQLRNCPLGYFSSITASS